MITINWCEWEDLVNESFIPYIENKDRYLIFYGGRGSSKSDFCAKKLIYRCLSENYFRCILVRNTYSSIKDSSYQTIKDIIFDLGLQSLFEFKLQPLEIHCINGNSFLARGCDDTTKLKSIKDPSCVWYEEDIPTEADFITITTSVRTKKATYLQEIFTINPEVEGHYQDNWFWKKYFQNRIEKTFSDITKIKANDTEVELTYSVHHSTYKDNKYLPSEFIAQLEQIKETNPYYYTIYCLGEWGNRQTGGLFYKLFDRTKSVSNVIAYNPNLALHISFDFNVNPYMSVLICQMVGKQLYIIDEITSKTPDNTTKGACNEFMRKYYNHNAGLFIYGDPSGKQQDTRTEAGYNDYKIIQKELEKYNPTMRVASVAPSIVSRGNFINTIFHNGYDGINVQISDKCKVFINDLIFVKEQSDGTKFKEKSKDKETGITSEKLGHLSDCFIGETLIKTNKGDKKIKDIKVGDKVLTRCGYKSVLSFMQKGEKKVKKYAVGKNHIICTDNHKFYANGSFISIGHLIGLNILCIFDTKSQKWKRKLLFIKELSLQDTQTKKVENIITEGLMAKKNDCTYIYMKKFTEKFLKVITYTIKMVIRLIMIFPIWSALMVENIVNYIWHWMKESLFQNIVCKNMHNQKQLNGTNQKKDVNGILSILKKLLKKDWLKLIVSSVTMNVLNQMLTILNFVVGNVNLAIICERIENRENGILKKIALFVDQNLKNISGQKQNLVQENAEQVYDIMVEDCHEFFANNILVHNCFDYLICEAFKNEYKNYQFGSDITRSTFGKEPFNHRTNF